MAGADSKKRRKGLLDEEYTGIFTILILLFDIYHPLRENWIRRLFGKRNSGKKPRKPWVLKAKNERDCSFCMFEKGQGKSPKRELPLAWSQQKGRGGPKKKISTQGYFCPNEECKYYGVTEESIHALVGDGSHGRHESIRDLRCQACQTKFTVRRNTILYRLKTQSSLIEKILWLLALGVDASALDEVFGVRENTIQTWLCRSGMQGRKLHDRFMVELELIHVSWTSYREV